jgi:hypothetical protein
MSLSHAFRTGQFSRARLCLVGVPTVPVCALSVLLKGETRPEASSVSLPESKVTHNADLL